MLFIFAFLYLGVLSTNSMVATKTVAQYQATVENKHVSHTYRTTFHYLTLSQWGTQSDNNDVSVDLQTYYRTTIGDTVYISQERGLWGIEWDDMKVIDG